MIHRTFFGDGEKNFAIPAEQILELERITGSDFGVIYARFMALQPGFAAVMAVIRLGLIGGGTSPQEAHALVETYAKPRPFIEPLQLAFDIITMRWNGALEDTPADESAPAAQDDIQQAAAACDLAAALRADIAEAYADVP